MFKKSFKRLCGAFYFTHFFKQDIIYYMERIIRLHFLKKGDITKMINAIKININDKSYLNTSMSEPT